MDYEKEKTEISSKFDSISREVSLLQKSLNEKQMELLRLEGEYRAVTRMLENKLDERSSKKVSST